MACTIASFLTSWANNYSILPISLNTSCVFSTAVTKTSTPTERLTRSGVFSPAISIRTAPQTSLRDSLQFQYVPVRIAKIEAASTAPVVELAVLQTPRRAAEHDLGFFDAAENGVEVAITNMESEMMAAKIRLIVEQQGQFFVHPYGAKCPVRERFSPKI